LEKLRFQDVIENDFGYCHYDIDPVKGACIHSLCVHKEHRRKGKARELVSAAIKEIRALGYDKEIGVEASPGDDGISKKDLVLFYKKMGLTVTNEEAF
jgi:GNAT superfamily N-acetyltransferase